MEDCKKSQNEILEIKTSTSKMINTLDGIKGRLNVAEEKISELEDSNRNYLNLKIQRKYFYSIYFRKKMIIEVLR